MLFLTLLVVKEVLLEIIFCFDLKLINQTKENLKVLS